MAKCRENIGTKAGSKAHAREVGVETPLEIDILQKHYYVRKGD